MEAAHAPILGTPKFRKMDCFEIIKTKGSRYNIVGIVAKNFGAIAGALKAQ
jgi:hypothetical protein